jgi:hypothetical protein
MTALGYAAVRRLLGRLGRHRRPLPRKVFAALWIGGISLLVLPALVGPMTHVFGRSAVVPVHAVGVRDGPNGAGEGVEFRPNPPDGQWIPVAPIVVSPRLVERYLAGDALVGTASGVRLGPLEALDATTLSGGARFEMADSGRLGGAPGFLAVILVCVYVGAGFVRRKRRRPPAPE